MLLIVISSIAITNLVVGYFLGTQQAFGAIPTALLDRLARRRQDAELDLPEAESLTAPAPAAAVPVAEQAPSKAPEPPAENRLKDASKTELMDGLAAFRDKLSAASVELKLNRDDDTKFDNSASKLQDANHEYLDQINNTIERLDELGSEGDKGADAAKTIVQDSAKEAEKVSGEIDSLIEGGLDSDSRSALIDKSVEMRDSVAATATAAHEADEKADSQSEEDQAEKPEQAEPASDKAESAAEEKPAEEASKEQKPGPSKAEQAESLEALFDKLDAALAEAGEDTPVLIAEVRPDKLEGIEDPDAVESVMLDELVSTAQDMLDETQAFVSGDRCVLLLQGDAFESAAQRMERIRQQMQAISYERGNETLHTTITCGIVEAKATDKRTELEQRLEQAIAESERLGANRTFHHDGAFPTPIPEMPAEVTKRAITLTA